MLNRFSKSKRRKIANAFINAHSTETGLTFYDTVIPEPQMLLDTFNKMVTGIYGFCRDLGPMEFELTIAASERENNNVYIFNSNEVLK